MWMVNMNGKTRLILVAALVLIVLAAGVVFFLPSLGRFSSGDTTRWVISRYVIGPVAALDTAQAGALISQQVEILPTEIRFQGKTCRNLVTRAETVDTLDYLSGNWKASPELLGLSQAELQVIHTNCDIPGFQDYMLLDGGKLLIGLDGVFFEFEPK